MVKVLKLERHLSINHDVICRTTNPPMLLSIVAVVTKMVVSAAAAVGLEATRCWRMTEDGNGVVWTVSFGTARVSSGPSASWTGGIATGCNTVCCALLPRRRSYDACRFILDTVAWAANLDGPCCITPAENTISSAVWRMQFGSF
jgi:hypothetical protein